MNEMYMVDTENEPLTIVASDSYVEEALGFRSALKNVLHTLVPYISTSEPGAG